MDKKIVIAGGTGFIGRYLANRFVAQGYRIVIISRQKPHVSWNDTAALIEGINHSEMLINLAGKSVDCRYNEKNKTGILLSRTETTKALGAAVLQCTDPPALWINSGTAAIYRHAEDRPMTEENGEIGTGFSVDVATAWEQAFFHFQLPATRQVVLRMAIVLGKGGGVLRPVKNLVRFGLGGKQGSGHQLLSWIHIEDLANIIFFLKEHRELRGVFNCSAPGPVYNKELMKVFRETMNIKPGLPSPEWLLKIGAVIIRTEPELVLKSRWVLPERLVQAGFRFTFPTIEKALSNLLKNMPA